MTEQTEPTFWDNLFDELVTMAHHDLPDGVEVASAQVARACTDIIDELLVVQRLMSVQRVQAVRTMARSGMSYAEIAAAVGLSRQRIEQLVNR